MLSRGIKIVVNAGGLNPAGLAAAARALYERLGLQARVAHIEGDDLLPKLAALQAAGRAAHASRQGHPAERAAGAGADRQRLSRRLGHRRRARARRRSRDLPARHRRRADARAGGVALRLGARRLGPARRRRRRRSHHRVRRAVHRRQLLLLPGGAAARRIPASRSPRCTPTARFVVTKHPGTGGLVSVGTVTAQLLYEIGAPAISNPDVTARFDTIQLDAGRAGPRARHGVRGEPPPPTTKVCINYFGGYKNTMTFVLTGLDIEAKARARRGDAVGAGRRTRAVRRDAGDAATRATVPNPRRNDEAFAYLTIAVKDPDAQKVGRAFVQQGRGDGARELPGLLHDHARRAASRRSASTGRRWCRRPPSSTGS